MKIHAKYYLIEVYCHFDVFLRRILERHLVLKVEDTKLDNEQANYHFEKVHDLRLKFDDD